MREYNYCKPIDTTVKMLFIEGSGNFLRPTITNHVNYCFPDKKETEYFEKLHFKKQVSTETTQKCSFKYNGYRSGIKYIYKSHI